MRAAEFESGFSSQPTGSGNSLDCRLGLVFKRLRFHAAGLICDCVVGGELCKATATAELHHQRVRCLLRADGFFNGWEVIGGGHLPQIQNWG
ncbi:hypothetical protein MAGR_58770 [Mycolicibacterium agri]|uniref:Uncharacterized protein n=1 Tax=Mycolicibacterium agri TaxID=36811 RepID=A0A7I9WB42_MYCAG|nr:hypothetical protein MAGR_58770 [Mycolicibacterium agri]